MDAEAKENTTADAAPMRQAVDLAPDLLERTERLYEQGLCRQALDLALQAGPMHQWAGNRARILAGRLALNMGAQRLGRALHVAAWRADPDDVRAQAYFVAAVFNRFGPYAAWTRIRRFADAAPDLSAASAPAAFQDLLCMGVRVLATWRDFERAEEWMQRATTLEADNPWPLIERAFLLGQMDRYEEALESSRLALQVHPWYRPAVQSVAHGLQVLDRDEEALALLEEANRRIENFGLLAQLAMLEMDREDFTAAGRTFDRLARLSPIMEPREREWVTMQQACAAGCRGDVDRALSLAETHDSEFAKRWVARLKDPRCRRRRVRLPIPFVRQHHMTCAPATLAALSRFWNQPTEHLEVAEAICYDGTPWCSQRNWAEENGFVTREFTVTWDIAVALTDRGLPFTLTTTDATSAHLQAVVGFDEARGSLLIRDPSQYGAVEFEAESLFTSNSVVGPRGMLMVPTAQADLLSGLELPDAAMFDQLHAIEQALSRHDREAAQAVLHEMLAAAPSHVLTLHARRAIASYDGNTPALSACLDDFLARFPTDAGLLLAKLGCLRELGRRDDRLALLERVCADREADSIFCLEYAQELRSDARKLDAALHWSRRALRRRPTDASALATMADCLWSRQQRAEAALLYRLAACMEDKREYRARTYFEAAQWLKQTDAALAFLRHRYDRLRGRSPLPAMTCFEALRQADLTPAAFDLLADALKRLPDDGELRLFAANACGRYGRFEEAQKHLRAAEGRVSQRSVLRARAILSRYRGDLKAALADWRAVAALDAASLDTHRSLTMLIAEVEGLPAALDHVQSVCNRFPHNFELHKLWADWAKEHSAPVAEPVLRRLVEINPADSGTRCELADNLSDQGRFEEALAQAEEAVRLDPNSCFSFSTRGRVHESAGNPAQAKSDYRQAIRLSADAESAIHALVAACDTRAEREEVLHFIEQELIRQVVFGDGVLAFREVAQQNLEPDKVLASMRLAHKERPDLWHTWSAVAMQLAEMLQLDEARRLAVEATERFPLVPRCWLDLAAIERQRLDTEAEIAALDRARSLSPGWTQAALSLAEAHERRGHFDRERAVLEEACAHAPLNAAAHGSLADVLWRLDCREEALERVRHALRLDPDCDWGWRALSAWSTELGQPHLAFDLASDLTQRRPGDARAWVVLGRMHAEAGQFNEALEAVDRALALQPRSEESWSLRARLLVQLGRHDEAMVSCAPPVFGRRLPAGLLARAAWIEYRRGNTSEAIARMEHVTKERPGYYWAWQELAEWHRDHGSLERSEAAVLQMTRLAPFHVEPLCELADLKLRRDARDEAKQGLQRSLTLDPTYAVAGLRLFDLQLEDDEPDDAAATLEVLRRHVGDGVVKACEIRLLLHRAPERARTFTRKEVPSESLAAAGRLLEALCASAEHHKYALSTAVSAFVESGHAGSAERILDQWMREPSACPHVGALWMRRRIARGKRRCPRYLHRASRDQLKAQLAIMELIEHLGKKGRIWRIRRLVWRHRRWLRQSDQGWGMVGYALVNSGDYTGAVRWMSDYASRREAEQWMLANLALAMRCLGSYDAAMKVTQLALALPNRDNVYPLLKLLCAAEAAWAGRTAEAAAHVQDATSEGLDEYERRLRLLTEGMLRIQQAPEDQRRIVFNSLWPALRRAFATVSFIGRKGPDARDFLRYAPRIARDSRRRLNRARVAWRCIAGF